MVESTSQIIRFPSTNSGTSTPILRKSIDTKGEILRHMSDPSGNGNGGDGGDVLGRIAALEQALGSIKTDVATLKTDIGWIIKLGSALALGGIGFGAWMVMQVISLDKDIHAVENQVIEKNSEIDKKLEIIITNLGKKR